MNRQAPCECFCSGVSSQSECVGKSFIQQVYHCCRVTATILVIIICMFYNAHASYRKFIQKELENWTKNVLFIILRIQKFIFHCYYYVVGINWECCGKRKEHVKISRLLFLTNSLANNKPTLVLTVTLQNLYYINPNYRVVWYHFDSTV